MHGTASCYINNGCRRPECRAANTARKRAQRARGAEFSKAPHGLSRYENSTCRCQVCRAANKMKTTLRRAKDKIAKGAPLTDREYAAYFLGDPASKILIMARVCPACAALPFEPCLLEVDPENLMGDTHLARTSEIISVERILKGT